MRWQSLASRLSGFSVPIVGGGVSWVPLVDERKVAASVLAFLEHKRVFEERPNREISNHIVASILLIREYLSTKIEENPTSSPKLLGPLRGMRRACVDSLRQLPKEEVTRPHLVLPGGRERYFETGPRGLDGLRDLRTEFALHAAVLAVHFKVDVEDQFADFIANELGQDDIGRIGSVNY